MCLFMVFFTDCPSSHAINISTMAGIADFLTFFNLLELFNVFYSKSYATGAITRREIFDFVEARRLSRTIYHKLNGQFCLVSRSPQAKARTIFDLQLDYFGGQLRALTKYKRQMNDVQVTNGIPLSSFIKKLRQLVAGNDFFLDAVEGKGGRPNDSFSHSFGWSPDYDKFTLMPAPPLQTSTAILYFFFAPYFNPMTFPGDYLKDITGITMGDYHILKEYSIPLSVFGVEESAADKTMAVQSKEHTEDADEDVDEDDSLGDAEHADEGTQILHPKHQCRSKSAIFLFFLVSKWSIFIATPLRQSRKRARLA